MFKLRIASGLLLALLAPVAWASPANHVLSDFGAIAVPFTHSIGNTFSGSSATGFASQDGSAVVLAQVDGLSYFYDDVVFSVPLAPQASFNAAAVTIDLSSFLSLQHFSARLYELDEGLASLTTGLPGSGASVQSWTSSALVGPGLSGTTVLFQNLALRAGASYALEFRGTIDGSFGGSYGGNLNIVPLPVPVPEPGGLALVLTSLGLLVATRRPGRHERL